VSIAEADCSHSELQGAPVEPVLRGNFLLQKVDFKWICHLLDDDQKLERVRVSSELLRSFESKSECSPANVYLRDKTCIYYNKLRSSVWASVDVARPTRARSFIGAKKVIISVSFSRSGIRNVVELRQKNIQSCLLYA
jgi:hypothetical protein